MKTKMIATFTFTLILASSAFASSDSGGWQPELRRTDTDVVAIEVIRLSALEECSRNHVAQKLELIIGNHDILSTLQSTEVDDATWACLQNP